MSAAQANFANTSKKAVHVKWAGKTIALGTFPSAEADEKCARAKALTRAWRSTMRPKPTRDWVMLELERLGVRVVSGRLGRKAGDEDESEKKSTGLDSGDPSMPPHRPLVGGGAAAAYEAARADHYAQKRGEQQRRASSLGLGAMGGGGMGGPQMGLSVNPNQHYEMLKLHHMNLLNEIQETTLMMNLYQQQQLQQQQQQLQQQQASAESSMGGGNDQMAMMMQQQNNSSRGGGGMDSMYGGSSGGGMGQSSLPGMRMGGGSGGGSGAGSSQNNDQMQMLRQQQMMQNGSSSNNGGGNAPANNDIQKELLKGQQEQQELENRLRKLKEDIAKRQREAEVLEEATGGKKRSVDGDDEQPNKRMKVKEEENGPAKTV